MDILKTSIEWTKAEVFSSMFFIGFAVIFLAASAGFWQIGKTDVARAYVMPLAVAGALLLVIGAGIFIQHQARVTGFAEAYHADAPAFLASEIARAEKVLNDYRIAVFMVIPAIIAVSAALFTLVLKDSLGKSRKHC